MLNHLLPLDAFAHQVNESPDRPYLHQPQDGKWASYTLKEVDNAARKIASAIVERGHKPGDRIALLSKNCADWVIADIAMMMAGVVSVPIYPSAGADTINYVLAHSGATRIFVGPLDDDKGFIDADVSVSTVGLRGCGVSTDSQITSWLENHSELDEYHHSAPDDMFTLVYTSGSTGLAKGVGITHENFRANSISNTKALGSTHHRHFSYLPLAHAAERTYNFTSSLYNSIELFFNESIQTFNRDLQYAEVTNFVSVPRLWAKFQTAVITQFGESQLEELLDSDKAQETKLKILSMLGWSNVGIFSSGTAPIAPSLLEWYAKLGINIVEGWGMTETGGAACANLPFKPEHIGTIGLTIDGFEMKLSENGEILIKGPAVFPGYYNNPEANAESFTDGWFHTGDKAVHLDDGAWKIVGRIKEQFKTAKGKYVGPVKLESLLSTNVYIEQVCVGGSGLTQPYALVVLPPELDRNNVEQIGDSLIATLIQVNEALEPHEKLSGLLVTKEQWTIENGMLTPTMKLRRAQIEQHYDDITKATIEKIVWE